MPRPTLVILHQHRYRSLSVLNQRDVQILRNLSVLMCNLAYKMEI